MNIIELNGISDKLPDCFTIFYCKFVDSVIYTNDISKIWKTQNFTDRI